MAEDIQDSLDSYTNIGRMPPRAEQPRGADGRNFTLSVGVMIFASIAFFRVFGLYELGKIEEFDVVADRLFYVCVQGTFVIRLPAIIMAMREWRIASPSSPTLIITASLLHSRAVVFYSAVVGLYVLMDLHNELLTSGSVQLRQYIALFSFVVTSYVLTPGKRRRSWGASGCSIHAITYFHLLARNIGSSWKEGSFVSCLFGTVGEVWTKDLFLLFICWVIEDHMVRNKYFACLLAYCRLTNLSYLSKEYVQKLPLAVGDERKIIK